MVQTAVSMALGFGMPQKRALSQGCRDVVATCGRPWGSLISTWQFTPLMPKELDPAHPENHHIWAESDQRIASMAFKTPCLGWISSLFPLSAAVLPQQVRATVNASKYGDDPISRVQTEPTAVGESFQSFSL